MSNFIQPIFDDDEDNPLVWLGKIAVAITVGAVMKKSRAKSHFFVVLGCFLSFWRCF